MCFLGIFAPDFLATFKAIAMDCFLDLLFSSVLMFFPIAYLEELLSSGMVKTHSAICLRCNKQCFLPKYRLKNFKYCSRSCKNISNTVRIKTNCAICGNEFEHISARCNKAKYCSRKCFYISQKNRGNTEYQCHHCAKKFRGHASQKRKYCSRKCVGKNQSSSWNPVFTTVRKKMIKEGMVNSCEICGYDTVKNILGIHHKDGDRNNNSIQNLQVLCPMCHSLIHHKHICH